MLIFVNTHQCVVKEAELRPFSTWPCPCLSCLPLTGRKLIYITDESKSSLQSWIIRLKSSCNLSNRLYFYWFTTQCSIMYSLWITRREQKEVRLAGVPGLSRPCCMAAGQSLNREVFQSPWAPPMLYFQTAPSLSWCISTDGPKERRDSNQHRLAVGFRTCYSGCNNTDTRALFGCFHVNSSQYDWTTNISYLLFYLVIFYLSNGGHNLVELCSMWNYGTQHAFDANMTTWHCDGVITFKFSFTENDSMFIRYIRWSCSLLESYKTWEITAMAGG